jgi:hypothetical protein
MQDISVGNSRIHERYRQIVGEDSQIKKNGAISRVYTFSSFHFAADIVK